MILTGGGVNTNADKISAFAKSHIESPASLESTQAIQSQIQSPFYDRIISCAVLEHIANLPEVVAYACLLLKDDGVFSAAIPSQDRFLWTMAYKLSTCAVLEHIANLPEVVAYACLLLKDDGVFSAAIPSQDRFLWTMAYKLSTGIEFRLKYKLDYDVIMNYEHINTQKEIIEICPSQDRFLWTMAYKLSTGIEFRLKYKLDYDVIMNYEHINTQKEIIEICDYFFDSVKKSLFGVSNELSIYTHLSCRKPNRQRAKEYLISLQA